MEINNLSIESSVKLWLCGSLPARSREPHGLKTLSENNFLDAHVDELVRELKGAKQGILIKAAYRLFDALITELGDRTKVYQASLTFFLRESNALRLRPPDLATLSRNLDLTPPCLYVSVRNRTKLLSVHEMYIRPLKCEESPVRNGVIYYSYRVGRNPVSNVVRRTFTRSIEVEFYPVEFLRKGGSPINDALRWAE